MKISLTEIENGYIIEVKQTDRDVKYVFKSTEVLNMLEWLGKLVYGKKIYIKE